MRGWRQERKGEIKVECREPRGVEIFTGITKVLPLTSVEKIEQDDCQMRNLYSGG